MSDLYLYDMKGASQDCGITMILGENIAATNT